MSWTCSPKPPSWTRNASGSGHTSARCRLPSTDGDMASGAPVADRSWTGCIALVDQLAVSWCWRTRVAAPRSAASWPVRAVTTRRSVVARGNDLA